MNDGTRDDRQEWAFLVRPGGEAVLGHGPFHALEAPPPNGLAFFHNDFGLTEPRPWRVPTGWVAGPADELRRRLPGGTAAWDWSAPDAAAFAAVFQEVVEAIRRGTFEKTVPAVVERGRLMDGAAAATAAAFLRADPACYGYGMVTGDDGFAGTTPELLLDWEPTTRRLRTMALAGTARSEEREVFAVDDKEIREHEYVAQSLVAKLTHLGSVHRAARRVFDLGGLVHFHTAIEVEVERAREPAELVAHLHPTPALGPLPRTPETLAMLGGWRRRLGCPDGFGAPFGVWRDGRFELVVAIRGIWWSGGEARLPAGCGVIEASRLVNEWRELRLKREAVKAKLAGC